MKQFNRSKKVLAIISLLLAGMAVQAQVMRTVKNYFVSETIPNNAVSRDGLTWQSAFATIDEALKAAHQAAGGGADPDADYNAYYASGTGTYNIYVAKGVYNMQQHRMYGGYMVNLIGGYPIPDDNTAITETCNANPLDNPTKMLNTSVTNSVFRLKGIGGGLLVQGFVYSGGASGGTADGTFVTLDGYETPDMLDGCQNKTLTLKDFVINEYDATPGGFIYPHGVRDCTVSFKNVFVGRLPNSNATLQGPMITVRDVPNSKVKNLVITVEDCSFNEIKTTGGVVTASGYTLFNINLSPDFDKGTSSVTIKNTNFCGNYTNNPTNPTLALLASAPNLYFNDVRNILIDGCTFTNSVAGNGAVINSSNSVFEMKNTIIKGNSSGSYGGTMYLLGSYAINGRGKPELTAAQGEAAKLYRIDNCKFYDNSSNSKGGVLYLQNEANLLVVNSDFINNKGADGAVFCFVSGTQDKQEVEISGSTFCNNQSSGNAGVMHFNGDVTLSSTSNIYRANQSANAGGVILTSNQLEQLSFTNDIFYKNQSKDEGGAMKLEAKTLIIKGSLFQENKSVEEDGGAVYVTDLNKLQIDGNTHFIGNRTAEGKGGGALRIDADANSTSEDFKLDNVTFEDNQATEGGAIYKSGSAPLIVSNAFFIRNHTQGGTGVKGGGAVRVVENGKYISQNNVYEDNTTKLYGGAIFVSGAISVQNDKYKGNKALTDHGGAIMISQDSETSIDNTQFEANTAQRDGGALYFDGTDETTSITNSEFLDNIATNKGGAIYVSYTFATTNDNIDTFDGNKFWGNESSATISKDIDLHSSVGVASNLINNCEMQHPLSAYKAANVSIFDVLYDGFDFGVNNKQRTTPLLPITVAQPTPYPTIPIDACPEEVPAVCASMVQTLSPFIGSTIGTDIGNTPIKQTTICTTEIPEAKVSFYSNTGIAPYDIAYKIETIDGTTQTSTTSELLSVATQGTDKGVSFPIPQSMKADGVTYIYKAFKITDARDVFTDYTNCDGVEMLRVHVQPQPKLEVPEQLLACPNKPVTLTANFAPTLTSTLSGAGWNNSTTAATWTWKKADVQVGSEQNYVIANLSDAAYGEYTVAVTDNNGCTNTKIVALQKPAQDSDGDGVADLCDLDSDNDGILDDVERNCSNPNSFKNGDLDIDGNTVPEHSILPTDWEVVPFSAPYCEANASGFLTSPDLVNSTSPSEKLAADPYSSSFCLSGMHGNVNGNLFHEGIRQSVSGLTVGKEYVISFYQTPTLLSYFDYSRVDDPSGKWQVYGNGKLLAITEETLLSNYDQPVANQYINPSDVNWEKREFIFNAEAEEIIFDFLPLDDDDDGRVLRMAIDKIVLKKNETCTDTDTDGDGIPNHLDLDSDNDGCPDAKEGAADLESTNTAGGTLTDGNGGIVTTNLTTTDVDANGVPTIATASGQGIGQSLDASKNDCEDSDDDGVPDWKDLDDDNDGILDTDECTAAAFIFAKIGNNLEATQKGMHVTMSSEGTPQNGGLLTYLSSELPSNLQYPSADALGNAGLTEVGLSFLNSGAYFIAGCDGTITTSATRTFTFDAPTTEPLLLSFTGLEARNSATKITFTAGEIIKVMNGTGVGTQTYTSNDLFTNTEPPYLVDAAGLTLLIPAGTSSVSYTLTPPGAPLPGDSYYVALSAACADTDGDGIPNRLDLDSDGDGCADAIEGAENVSADMLNTNMRINITSQGGVDAQGVPNVVNSGGAADEGADQGQGIGSSQNAAISGCYLRSNRNVTKQLK